jgi:glycerophosphoryl diester phosphodiesterase
VDSFTLTEIKSLDAGSFKGPEFKDERIPTLDETLALFVDKKLNPTKAKLLIELKFSWFDIRKGFFASIDPLAEEVTKKIQNHKAWDVVVVQSFIDSYLEYIHREDPKIETHLLAFPWRSTSSLLAVDFVKSYNLNVNFVSRDFCEKAEQAGKTVYVWTADTENQLAKSLESNVHGIITNFPEKARSFVTLYKEGKYEASQDNFLNKVLFYKGLVSHVLPGWLKMTLLAILLAVVSKLIL